MIPVLMITHGRLEYTKKAIEALLLCDDISIYIYDNKSEDDTMFYLWSAIGNIRMRKITEIFCDNENKGISAAMNWFLGKTKGCQYISKIDNDTVVPPDFFEKMLPHMVHTDLVQAKHKLIAASKVGTFDEWVSKMPKKGNLRFNHFIGGSGVLMKRQLIDRIPETENKLQGWRQWQREHPEVKKAFALDCEIQLLDEHGYEDYPEYYKQTGRV